MFQLGSSMAGSKFCEGAYVRIDVYIPHRKYHIGPNPSTWFSAAFLVAVAHRNNVFCLYQRNKSSESKVNFKQASIVLEVVKLASKAKESITSQKLGSREI